MARIQLDVAGSAGIKGGVGASLGDTRVDVLLPETSLASAPKAFPVLWLLHDYGGNHADWARYTNLEIYAEKKEWVVVCPSGENSYYVDIGKGWTGTADATYISENLRNLVMAMFPCSRAPEDHYIAGVGMGGYGALHILSKKPDYYGGAISVHGDLDAPNRYAKGDFRHPYGEELFGPAEMTEGRENDLYFLKGKQLKGKKICVAAASADGSAWRWCDAAQTAGAAVERDVLTEEKGLEQLDFFGRYILDRAAAMRKERT